MKKVDNIIFLSSAPNIRAGGPAGYIANLWKGLSGQNVQNIALVAENRTEAVLSKRKVLKFLVQLVPFSSLRRKWRKRLEPKAGYDVTEEMPVCFKKILDKYDFQTVTCHGCKDTVWLKQYIKKRGLKAKVLQMSHSPVLPSKELYSFLLPVNPDTAREQLAVWQSFEHRAFEAADVLLAPSSEALDTYRQDAAYFNDLLKRKSVKFLPTGCAELPVSNKDALRQKYGITTPFVICYVGRHESVRGYDRLKEIGRRVLETRQDVTFLIGGALGNELKPLVHPRWIELGWTNPAEVFSASDLFVSPGRQVYFDLILLEALSAGKNVLAAAAGGNISVWRQTQALELFKNEEECIEQINHFLGLDESARAALSLRARAAYEQYYTLDAFASNYRKCIQEVLNEAR